MIVDRLEWSEVDDRIERSARVRWKGREFRLAVSCPPDVAGPAEDASPFVAATLLMAMRLREDLDVDGNVSPRLHRRLDELQTLYYAWDRELRRADVRVAGEQPAFGGQRHSATFFSRGVDSMYEATAHRHEDEKLAALVFGVDLEPVMSGSVQREELRLARECADRLGLAVIPFHSNVREFHHGILDWADYHGAALAFVALAMSGGIERVVIGSAGWYGNLDRIGSSPLLDPLFSTESVAIEHGTLERGRAAKVAWMAENAPQVLPYLKVCFAENRADNCGRCPKCLITMLCLEGAGALGQASAFPDELDLRAVRRMRAAILANRIECMEAAELLARDPRHENVRRALLHALRRSARWLAWDMIRDRLRGRRQRVRRAWTMTSSNFRRHESREMYSLLVEGRPYWLGPSADQPRQR